MKKLSILVLLASISCGGNESAPPPASPSSPSSASAAPASAASAAPSAPATSGDTPAAFHDMNKQQRSKYMRDVVVPKMRPLFAQFDEKKFGKFGCGTCHGAGATDGSFKMPSAQLPELPSTPDGFEALGKKHPEMMKFMATTVKPEMAKLLGEKEMDPKNPSAGGFGCMSCHTMKK